MLLMHCDLGWKAVIFSLSPNCSEQSFSLELAFKELPALVFNFSRQRITHGDRSDNLCTSTAAASITPFFTMFMVCFLSTLVFRRRSAWAKNIFFTLDQRATVPRAQGSGFLLSLRILQTLTQVVKYRNHKGQQQRLTAPLTTLGRQDQGIQLRCLSSLRYTSPTANLSTPPKAKSRSQQGNNFGLRISLCGRPIGWFTGRLASSINRDPRLKMESFCFPRLIIEAECSSLSANVCFDLRRSQHFLSLVGCCSKTNICSPADSRCKMDSFPLFVSFEAAEFATRPLSQHALVCSVHALWVVFFCL